VPLAEGIQLNLPLPAYVPEDYLPEEKLRLRLYRRLAGLNTLKGIDDIAREMEDRFGNIPSRWRICCINSSSNCWRWRRGQSDYHRERLYHHPR